MSYVYILGLFHVYIQKLFAKKNVASFSIAKLLKKIRNNRH